MKKLILIFILSSGYLFSQADSTKKWDLMCYKATNSFYLYTIKHNNIYFYNFSSSEVTDFSKMFWKSSKTIPIDTTMYQGYLVRRITLADLQERVVKELK